MLQPIQFHQNRLKIIDQTLLPEQEKWMEIHKSSTMFEAIQKLRIRGAPALGIAGIFGVWIGIKNSTDLSRATFIRKAAETGEYLKSARPTAVNLSWAIDRGISVLEKSQLTDSEKLADLLLKEALKIWEEDVQTCRLIGEYGSTLISDGDTVLTHCNAGALATGAYGTALSAIYFAHQGGKNIHVFVDETRPLLQGARLTIWELLKNNVPCTLICDNMAAHTVKTKNIRLIITGADRIAANGDTANKIGTYNLGIIARYHNIPLYIAAPLSTFDFSIPTGNTIVIEERAPCEVIEFRGVSSAPANVNVYNPAFDVVPHSLISAFITEKGIFHPSEIKSLHL